VRRAASFLGLLEQRVALQSTRATFGRQLEACLERLEGYRQTCRNLGLTEPHQRALEWAGP
jgi:hypothetical protein